MSTTVQIDDKGRVYLPSEVKKMLGLKKGDRLRVRVRDRAILLEVEERNLRKLRRGTPWGAEAFLDAGEALVSD